jgi:hypothetical protein
MKKTPNGVSLLGACLYMKHVKSARIFVNLLKSLGIDSQPGEPVRQPYLSYPGPLGYIGWRNRFLGIDSWAP